MTGRSGSNIGIRAVLLIIAVICFVVAALGIDVGKVSILALASHSSQAHSWSESCTCRLVESGSLGLGRWRRVCGASIDQVGDRPQLLARRQSISRLHRDAGLELGHDRFQSVCKIQGFGITGRGHVGGTPGRSGAWLRSLVF
jgi:hypothetical protein